MDRTISKNKKKTALVMEGGGMRGMFTCGVIDVFMEQGIEFDAAIGVSAGAAFGCNIKSKQIGRAIRYNKKYCATKDYSSIGSLIKTGDLFNSDFCYRKLPFELDIWDQETFSKNPMKFITVSTDVNTGKPNYHLCNEGLEDDIDWIRASASIPLVSKPVSIGGGLYLDGGISDSIPLKYMQDEGYEKIVVIETQTADYVKKPYKIMPLAKLLLRKYPNMIRAMADRHIMYNNQKAYVKAKEDAGDIIVIRPEAPLNISSASKEPAELERVYQIGRRIGLMRAAKVSKFIKGEQ